MAGLRKLSPILLLMVLAGCRLDMHVQPRQNPLAKSEFFADQRSARPVVEARLLAASYMQTPISTPAKWATTPATICRSR